MKTLLVGYKAADLTPELLEGDVTCHVLDIYHRHAIEKVHHAKVVCSAHLPEGPWDLIRFTPTAAELEAMHVHAKGFPAPFFRHPSNTRS